MSNRGEKESEEERNRREMRFLRLWGACQPSLFPEWEREMDLREAEEERRRPPGGSRPCAGCAASQQSIRIVCSTAMTIVPSRWCSAIFFGARTLTLRPPCASSRWLNTRSAALLSL